MPAISLLRLFAILALAAAAASSALSAPTITVEIAKDGAEVSKEMTGIFFEDINFGADGGLYPELVKNRSFEFEKPLAGWRVAKRGGATGDVQLIRDAERQRNPRYARIRIDEAGQFSLANEGFRGMGIKAGAGYYFSLTARKGAGNISAIRAEITGGGKTLAEGKIEGFGPGWKTHEIELTALEGFAKATLNVWIEGAGTIDIDNISLFPKETWKGRKGGLRADLVQLLADMKPGFLRFPGGCIVEGYDLHRAYRWKDTIGPVDDRVININRWNTEFAHRLTPDYYQSYGLGFYEYFQLCEDIGAAPMPIVNCGMACQFNSAELTPMDQLGPYVQDALDLIEFANAPADSAWGKVRAQMGHPEPFGMTMLGVGNEQWGPQYVERYLVFEKAIKAKYPDIKLIAATGSDPEIFPNGRAEVPYLWEQWRKIRPDFVDEHFYRMPEWFLQNTNYYDKYSRTDPKIFVGEYAAQSVGVAKPENRNIWKTALYEAAFMTGMERNADLVRMACYAPLFGNEDAWQWRPDMIWFDNTRAYGSANYQVQKLFSLNTGSRLLKAAVADAPTTNGMQLLHASATLDEKNNEAIVKVVNAGGATVEAPLELKGGGAGGSARAIVLASPGLNDENTLDEPLKIVPKESTPALPAAGGAVSFQPYSVTVLHIPLK